MLMGAPPRDKVTRGYIQWKLKRVVFDNTPQCYHSGTIGISPGNPGAKVVERRRDVDLGALDDDHLQAHDKLRLGLRACAEARVMAKDLN
jgi:ribosomal protein S3AE